jgi:PncC family amidohydrolase
LISHRITNVAGASEVYLGGVVAYSNAAKQHLLGVSQDTLDRFGAVSEQTVKEMAQGVKHLFQVQTAISVSGIAGPGGGSPQKPVGTVWIGLAVLDQIHAHLYRFFGTREQIKQQSAEAALWWLAERIAHHGNQPALQRRLRATQPIAVEFSGTDFASLRIRAIYWQENWIPIESIGRRWQDASGSHFLTLSYQGKVYEVMVKADGCWYLRSPRESLHQA